MANVLLLCGVAETAKSPYVRRDLERLRQAAECDVAQVHKLVEDPDKADLILFVGSARPGQVDVLRHPLMLRHPEKCFVIDANDRTLPIVPGIYVSAERTWWPRHRFTGGFYFRVWENDTIEPSDLAEDAPHLFSFMGAGENSSVRQTILRLAHPRAVLFDTTKVPLKERQRDGSTKDEYTSRYAETLARSKFVLCPRGIGSSSWRLFEAMKAGRAPVIISDAWVAPRGPDWGLFSIRMPERDIASLPSILERNEHRAIQMGRDARLAWEAHFSKEVAFHRVVEACLELRGHRRTRCDLGRAFVLPHLLRPFFLRHWVFHLLKASLVRRS